MKIHWRPPLLPDPLPQPPRKPPTPLEQELQAEEMINAAQTQRARLKKLHGSRRILNDFDDDSDSAEDDSRSPQKQNIDVLA